MPEKKQSAWRFLWRSEDIRRKLLITLGILMLFRIAANIPVPGADREALGGFLQFTGGSGGFLGFLNLLSGGTIQHFSLLSMGVYPYITAQIILQLLIPIIPSLQRRMQEDQREGRRWMEKWTYYLAVPMTVLSAIGQINIFNSLAIQGVGRPVIQFAFTNELWLPSLTVLLVMTAGTMFAIWLGELISEYGIRGQGLSLVIFAGIVSQIPANFQTLWLDEQNRWILLFAMVIVIVVTVLAIVYVQQGRRNVPIMYPQKSQVFYAIQRGKSVRMPQPTLPLMVNLSGMIPLIFASAILQFPAIIASYFLTSNTGWVKNVATATQKYLSRIQSRITLPGAVLLGTVAIMPFLLRLILPAASTGATLFLTTSSGLLIVVGVVRDTFMNIEAELKLHGYQEKLLIS